MVSTKRTHLCYVPTAPDLPLHLIRKAFQPINPPRLPTISLRIPVKLQPSQRRAHLPFHYSLILPPSVVKPLEEMCRMHCELTCSTKVTASVKVVHGTPCPRWHVDKVALRGLCTLHGRGCEIRNGGDEGDVKLEAGDLVFLPGSGPHNDRVGVVHKSPDIDHGDMRIVLQTDCVDER